jgi:hydrogenase maturation protease
MSAPAEPRALVVGYGSDLRGDDAAGRYVAEALERRAPPGVRVRSVHQLLPELTPELAGARLVIFVDAQLPGAGERVGLARLGIGGPWLGHSASPGWLLEQAERLYGARPEAWLVSIPAAQDELGAGLSDLSRRGAAEALRHIRRLLRAQQPLAAPR